jgi:exopolysaccharide biosynthesis polyprenyl glycosylphosphotransferase
MASVEQFNEQLVTDSAFPTESARSYEHFELVVSVLERGADLVTIILATSLAYCVYTLLQVGNRVHYSTSVVIAVGFLFAVTFVGLLDHAGGYELASSLLRIRETERVLRVATQTFAIAFSVTFFFPHCVSRWVVALATLLVPLLLVTEKQMFVGFVRFLHSKGYGIQRVLVYGAGSTGRRVFSALMSSPKVGLNPIAFVDDNSELTGHRVFQYAYTHQQSAPVIAGPITPELIRQLGVNLVILGIPSLARERLNEIASVVNASGATVAFVPQLSFDTEAQTNYVILDGVLVASLSPGGGKRIYQALKRVFDFTTAMILLVLALPVWVILAVLIRCDSKGSVFFHQRRIGMRGKPFRLYKFRTMYADTPKFGIHPTTSDDPRVTRVGRWLRRTSLDELPQLINIINGDMSLVGPRPEMPFIVDQYSRGHRQRLEVTPGLTGLWQLSADRRFLIHENIQYDLYYIRNRNFFMDVAILMHTVVFAMKGV